MPNPPSTQSVCPHGCVNGVITDSDLGGEGTSSYCPIHGSMAQRVDRMNEVVAAAADHAKRAADKLRASSPDTQTEECYEDSHAGYNSETGACLTCGKLVHGVLYGDELRRAEGMCKAPPSRAELWRCPECGAAAWHSTAEYPLPGGPALCTHPTPIYERFTLAEQLDQAERRAEEAKAEASEANHQANMMSRNLQAANAFAAFYRQGLEQIAEITPDENDPAHGDGGYDAGQIARSLLNPSSTSEGER